MNRTSLIKTLLTCILIIGSLIISEKGVLGCYSVSVAADPQYIPPDGNSTSAITATLKDVEGNEVSAEFKFSISPTVGSIKSDENKTAATYTSSTTPAKVKVTAETTITTPTGEQTFSGHTYVYVVEVEKIDVWDSDNRYAAGELLEIVPASSSEGINGQAFIKPEDITLPPDFPEWKYGNAKEYGETVSFNANGWKSDAKILRMIKPESAGLLCVDKSVLIKRYPYNISEVEVSTEKVAKIVSNAANWILSWISGVEVEAPTAKFNFENQWKEKPSNNKVIWIYIADVKFDPLIGVSGKALTIKPKKLEQLLKKIKRNKLFEKFFKDIDVEFYVSLEGKAKPSLHFEKKVDGTYETEVTHGKYNEIGIEGGGEVTLKLNKKWKSIALAFSAYANAGSTMFFTTGAYRIGDREIGIILGIGNKGVEAKIGLEVKVPWIEEPFTLGPYGGIIVPKNEIKPRKIALFSF